jgi:caffeoyl-CoA O-methyltransferase
VALTSFAVVDGDFDIVYDDIDKHGYPDAWRAARDRVRVGGLYICDNTLWYGRVPPDGEAPDDVTQAIREHNAMVAGDERYVTTILPIRDGVLVALRRS